MWMDRDPQSRRSSIETYLAPDVEFRSPFGQARGYDELEKYSDFLQEKYPGTGFFVDGPVQLIGDYVRLPFVLKEHDGSTVATGQDPPARRRRKSRIDVRVLRRVKAALVVVAAPI
jgi:hypothetical protein